jgi:EAL domain-containing protein (putative c-di-GMP-specific phosphodiesterase class I)
MEIEMDLRRAIDRRQFHLVYQHIVSAATREVVAVEALLRWRHPVRGAIPPATFIPIAEETGSIVAIGEWVLGRACRDLSAWPAETTVNVNLSAVQLQERDLVERVGCIIRRHDVAPHRVRLEVTETAIAADPDAAARTLHALRDLGVQLCIDDFGIGYSSLASLLRFPFTSLKIDRSLIAGVAESFEHREMVAAIATLARNLHLDVVAEGIETAEQLQIVEDLGVDLLQGFLLSLPSAIEELVA